jgi:DNA transformation protein and related proteins
LDHDFIRELFAPFRPVAVKRMFGGAGIYAEGLMFALVFDGVIYLRIDDAAIPDFEREGSAPFVYPLAKNHAGRPSRHFWRLPERLYDDPDELAVWAGHALAIAERRKTAPRERAAKKAAAKKAERAKISVWDSGIYFIAAFSFLFIRTCQSFNADQVA